MKKFLSIIFLTFFCVNIFSINIYASSEDLISIKTELQSYKKGEKYIKIIDSFIESKNHKKLKNISSKIDNFLSKNTIKETKTLLIVKYLKYKIDLTLSEKENILKDTKSKTKIENVFDSEKQTVEAKILNLQKNIISTGKNIFKKWDKNLEKKMNIKQDGDMFMKLDFDYKKVGNLNIDFDLEDYKAESNSDFKSSLKGNIKQNLNYNLEGIGEGILNFTSDYEQISSDGDLYIAVKNFHISDKNEMQDIEKFLNILEDLGKKDEYIRFPAQKESKDFYAFLQNINSNNFDSKILIFQKNPLFETYGKNGDKYLLKPTKFACNKFKELENIFDPINGKICSDSQYQKMLEDFREIGEFYIKINGENIILGTNFYDKNVKSNFYIAYDSNSLEEINFEIKPNSPQNDGLKFNGVLDENNIFSKISFYFKNGKNNIDFNLENNKISGKINLINDSYSYKEEKWQKIETSKIIGVISGNTNSINFLENLKINLKGIDLQNNNAEFLNFNAIFSEKYLNIFSNITKEGFKSNFDISANFDENYFPKNGNLKIEFYKKDGIFDSKTFKYNYLGDFKKVFSSNIKIENKNISGQTIIPNYLLINHDGWLDSERFNLDNSIELKDKFVEMINSIYEDNISSINGVLNISSEYANNKETKKITSYFDFSGNEVFRLEIKNNYTINYKKRENINIEIPENYVNIEDLNG